MIFGFCMGGAMAVAMACDPRFAAEGARFGIPAARLGIIYGADSVGQLVDLVGPAYAKDILCIRWAERSVDQLRTGWRGRNLSAIRAPRTPRPVLSRVPYATEIL